MNLISRIWHQLIGNQSRRATHSQSAALPPIPLTQLAWLEEARDAFQAGTAHQARAALERLERDETALGEAWLLMGHLARIERATADTAPRALTCYARARQLGWQAPDLAIGIAAAYLDQFRVEEAMRELLHVREQSVDLPLWHFQFARACEMRNDFRQAHGAYSRALELAPTLLAARKARAQTLAWMGEFDACREEISNLRHAGVSALDIAREYTMVAWVMGDLDLHEGSARTILAEEPDEPGAQLSLGNVLMTRGKFAQGWQLMEARLRHPVFPQYQAVLPRWNGEDLTGKHLWLFEEQGFGDEILFARFVSHVVARAARVTLQCKPPLAALFSSLPGVTVVPHKGRMPAQDMAADYELPLMSLPALLGLNSEAVLSPVQPFAIAPATLTRWSGRVNTAPANARRRLRVGLAVSGRVQRKDNLLRSIALELFAPVLDVDAEFFWVQPDLDRVTAGRLYPQVRDFTSELGDFAETAGLLSQLDLVISVDTAVAHLAATQGLETWVLIPQMRDWRWDVEGAGCLWYRRVHTWRVPRSHDWQPVIADVALRLRQRSAEWLQAGR